MPSRKRTPKPPPAEELAAASSKEPAKAEEASGPAARRGSARKTQTASQASASAALEESPETRAHDLLPQLSPPQDKPRRVGLRRVVGHALGERLLSRRGFRPAGNSRRFWRRVEVDDPFLAQPDRPRWEDEAATLQPGMARAPAAAARLSSAEPAVKSAARSAPQPSASRPSPSSPGPRPAPQRQAAPKVAPTPTHTPDPRPIPAPPPRPAPAPAERAPAEPPPSSPAAAPIDRRPRIVPHQPQVRPGGRLATPSNFVPRPHLVNRAGQTPEEVRREAQAARRGPPPPPPPRSLDEVLAILGELQASERLYRQGLLNKGAEEVEPPRPAPRPQKVAQPAPRPAVQRPPAPKPAPSARPPHVSSPAEIEEAEDEQAPAPSSAPAPIDRSPSRAAAGSNGASLDDLFGAGDTRMKIGRRTVRKQPEPSSEDS